MVTRKKEEGRVYQDKQSILSQVSVSLKSTSSQQQRLLPTLIYHQALHEGA